MTQVTSTVDFEAPGKQIGWLRVPHSVTRSAYGVIPVPVAVLNNGEGPRILLTAGNHGDVRALQGQRGVSGIADVEGQVDLHTAR